VSEGRRGVCCRRRREQVRGVWSGEWSSKWPLLLAVIAGLAGAVFLGGCSGSDDGGRGAAETSLRVFSGEDFATVEPQEGVSFEAGAGSDGGGALRIEATGPKTVRLFTVEGLDVEEAMLIYRLELRSEGLSGTAYPEMWCSFAELGDYFSRGLESTVTGDAEWTTRQTPFRLEKGQNPDAVQFNVVVDGAGTVWVERVELLRTSLQ